MNTCCTSKPYRRIQQPTFRPSQCNARAATNANCSQLGKEKNGRGAPGQSCQCETSMQPLLAHVVTPAASMQRQECHEHPWHPARSQRATAISEMGSGGGRYHFKPRKVWEACRFGAFRPRKFYETGPKRTGGAHCDQSLREGSWA